ncbi:hypothetical protein KJ815_11720, partial [bacterium]|nr:hypothetical protein [bacterium]
MVAASDPFGQDDGIGSEQQCELDPRFDYSKRGTNLSPLNTVLRSASFQAFWPTGFWRLLKNHF